MTSWHEFHQYGLENGGMDDPPYCPLCGVHTGSGVLCENCRDEDPGANVPDEPEVRHCGLPAEDHKLGGAAEHNFIPRSDMPGSISDSYDGPADPCPACNPNGVPSGHANPTCLRCAGTFWLPDGNCLICGDLAEGYYQGRKQFPTCGGRRCEMKMQGGIDAHEKGTNR